MHITEEFKKKKLDKINSRLQKYYDFDGTKQVIALTKGKKLTNQFVDENMKSLFDISNVEFADDTVPRLANKIAIYKSLDRRSSINNAELARQRKEERMQLEKLAKAAARAEKEKAKVAAMQMYKENIPFYGIH